MLIAKARPDSHCVRSRPAALMGVEGGADLWVKGLDRCRNRPVWTEKCRGGRARLVSDRRAFVQCFTAGRDVDHGLIYVDFLC